MANILLQLDQTSKDSLYTAETLTNDTKQWLLDTTHNDDADDSHHMHVNVTLADKCSSPTNKLYSLCGYNNQVNHQRYESPFPYNSSLNYYYYNKTAVTTSGTATYNDDVVGYLDFQSQMIGNSNHQKPLDPHIDDFDIVRAKVTGITRAMQQYHIDELEQEQAMLSSKTSSIYTGNFDPLDTAGLRPLSPLSILCPTTNSLVQSRAMEEFKDNEDEQLWHEEFLNLMSKLIVYSESLESLSTDLLRTEGKVRELVLLQKSMLEEYQEKEKLYLDRLDECEQIAQQQQQLMDHLVELDRDLDLTATKTSDNNKRITLSATTSTSTTTTTTLSTIYRWQSSEHGQPHQQQQERPRNRRSTNRSNDYLSATLLDQYDQPQQQHWDFSRPIKDIVGINSMEDLVYTLRWEVGLWIGGGVGTGHVIHSFESPLNGIELIIAGSGTIATTAAPNELRSSSSESTPSSSLNRTQRKKESYTLSSSIRHLCFHRHHYMLHINKHVRETQFKLLPKNQWVPDQQTKQCQFKTATTSCTVKFGFFQRRHHCRRCGIVVCQRHSLNRLPLFTCPTSSMENWYRVCDGCFYDLIINKKQVSTHDSAADLTEIC